MQLRRLPRNATRAMAPALLMVTLLVSGCSTHRTASDPDSVTPGSSAGALLGADPGALRPDQLTWNSTFLMPLAVGNRWDYTVRTRTRLISPGSPDVIETWESPWTSEIVSKQPINTQEYYLQAEYDPRSLEFVVARWGLRQNRSGLYSLDLPVRDPLSAAGVRSTERPDARFASALAAAAAKSRHPAAFAAAAERLAGRLFVMSMPGRGEGLPGMSGIPGLPARSGDFGVLRRGHPLPGEISLLVYPMFVGSRWVVRESPRFTRVVEGRERTAVPAGVFETWIQRGHSELYGRSDVVRFYYAREGLIRITVHAEQEVTDLEGNALGRMIMDMDQSLSSLTLGKLAN